MKTAFTFFLFILGISILRVEAQTFTDVHALQGIPVLNPTVNTWGTGISFYDFNNDGWDDLSFANENDTQVIFINNQGLLELAPFKINNAGECKMILWADYDNDGFLDLLIGSKENRVRLYKNDGAFNFQDVTNTIGLNTGIAPNYGASFGDYDKDGFLDLYVCKYIRFGDTTDLNLANNLYHNNGDGTFTDVTISSGVFKGINPSFQCVWFDYNLDTWPDLFVVNDRLGFPNNLFRNNGDGTFTDVAVTAGIAESNNDFMSGSVADYDNDNDLDVFMSNTSEQGIGYFTYPYLFENQGNGNFINQAGNRNLELEETTWGGLWIDYDNNGFQDLYVATAYIPTIIPPIKSYFCVNNFPNAFNLDSAIFLSNHVANSHAVARGDLNNDGFYDIAVNNEAPDTSFLWLNSGNTNNYVKITLEGTVSNRFAIGSWIRVFVGQEEFTQYTFCGENYIGQNSQHHIFGLSQYTIIDSIEIEYLSGIVDHYYNLAVNQAYHFVEGETSLSFELLNPDSITICLGDSVFLLAPEFTSYLWSTGEQTREILATSSGNYFLTATDSLGRLLRSDTVVLDVFTPQINGILENPSCAESHDGFIFLGVQNQGMDYTVQWQDNTVGDSLLNLSAGTYRFDYLDSLGCTYRDSFVLTAPYALNVQTSILPETPNSFGSIAVLVNGGMVPYTFYLDSVLVGNFIDGLSAGSYDLEIIDANACSFQQELTVLYADTSANTSILHLNGIPISVYPIPFENGLHIFFESQVILDYEIVLIDVHGKKIVEEHFASSAGSNVIDLIVDDNLVSGNYWLRIGAEGKFVIQTLVKK